MADTQVTFDIVARDRASRDFKRVGDSADRAGDRFRRFGAVSAKVAKTAGVALGGALLAVGAGMAKAAKAAAEEEQEMAQLSNALRRNAKATDAQVDSTEDWITATQNATGVADSELRPALAKLVGATKNTEEAQKLLTTALDASAGSGKSVETISAALARAYNGNVGALGRLGIKVQDTTKDTIALQTAQLGLKNAQQDYTEAVEEHGAKSEEAARAADKVAIAQAKVGAATEKTKKTTVDFGEALDRVNKQFGGAAAAAADTAAGRYRILRARFDDLVESVGYKLLPFLNRLLVVVEGRLIPAAGDLARWFREDVQPALQRVGTYITERLLPAFREMAEDVAPVVQQALKDIAADVRDVASAIDRLTVKTAGANDSFNLLGLAIKGFSKLVSGIVDDIAQTIQVILFPFEKLAQAAQWFLDTIRAIPGALRMLDFSGIDFPQIPKIPGLASGGSVTRSGMAWVGERGPELVKLPARATVYDAQQSAAFAGGAGGLKVEQTIVTADPKAAADESVRGIRRAAWSAGWGVV